MSGEEKQEYDRRWKALEHMARVRPSLEESTKWFSTIFLDHAAGGVVVVGSTDPDAVPRDQLIADLGTDKFEVRRMDRTFDTLQADYEAISAQVTKLGRVGLSSVVLDETTNAVRVSSRLAESVPEVRAGLAGVPDYVQFEVAEIQTASAVAGGDSLTTCSAGAQVYADTAFGRLYYTLTAAHCPNAQTHRWSGIHGHNLPFIAERGAPFGVAVADVQIHFAGTNIGAVRNYSNGNTTGVTAESTFGDPADQVGALVCKVGRVTQLTCATLQSTNQTVFDTDSGITYIQQRLVYCAGCSGPWVQPGDSGGVVYTPTIYGNWLSGGVYGFLTGSGGYYGTYAHIQNEHAILAQAGAPFVVRRIWE